MNRALRGQNGRARVLIQVAQIELGLIGKLMHEVVVLIWHWIGAVASCKETRVVFAEYQVVDYLMVFAWLDFFIANIARKAVVVVGFVVRFENELFFVDGKPTFFAFYRE